MSPDETRKISRTNDFPTLLHLADTSQILFRVTDPTSISPLYWTGRPSTSGFSSPNLNLAYLDPKSYQTIFTSPSPPSLAVEEPYLRHTVLDHVMAKEKQTCLPTLSSIDERPDTPEDEKTPWISTSTDLGWVVFEVIRRLVFLKRESVWVSVIAYPGRATASTSEASAAGGAGGEGASGGAIGTNGTGGTNEVRPPAILEVEEPRSPEVMINPALVLRMPHVKAKDLMLSVGMKENYDLARSASEISSERLIWGRVFAESILDHYEFTLDHSPILLPSRLYKLSKQDGKGWTDGLVWDPRVDAYDAARRLMLERQRQIDAGHP